MEERTGLLASLKRRAQKLHRTLAGLEGMTCTEAEGALYLMPRIRLPPGAVEVGRALCMLCCMPLLGLGRDRRREFENTGQPRPP